MDELARDGVAARYGARIVGGARVTPRHFKLKTNSHQNSSFTKMSGKGDSALTKVPERGSVAPQEAVCRATAGDYTLLEVCKRNVRKWEEAVPE